MTYIFSLSDPRACDSQATGNKAATLAKLSRLGFPVPQGFVATTSLCQDVLASMGPQAAALESALLGGAAGAIADSDAAVAKALASARLPERFDDELRAVLSAYAPSQRFAVRSSSPEEDSSAASFAGQFDTYLNCCGFEAVKSAVLKCMLSLWSPRSLAYRRFHKLSDVGAIGVFIQEMVDCDLAGVAFSINPVSGALDEIVVNAHPGLGDSVVDGESDVEEHVVAKVGAVTPSAGGEALIGAASLEEIRDLVVRLEALSAFPQDVEWGLKDGTLALLQSRPISAFPAAWTRDRSAERFPYPITPLIWDVIQEGFHRSLKFSLDLMGLPPFAGRWFSSHGHYVYFNNNASEIYAKCVSAPMRHLRKGPAGLRPMLNEMAWLRKPLDHWDRHIDVYLDDVMALTREQVDGKSQAQLWSYAHRIRDLAYRYFAPNFAISLGHGMLMRALRAAVTPLVGTDGVDALMSDLTTGCKTKTGLFNDQLQSLVSTIGARSAVANALLTQSSETALEVILADPEARPAFQDFLAAHYHREVDHFLDPYYASLGEQPLVLVDNIRLILQGATREESSQASTGDRRHQALANLLSVCPQEYHADMLELVELTRTYIGLDDTEHYQTSRLHTPTRRCLQAVGRLLVEAGLLDEPLDVCFADFDAFEKAMQGGDWRAVVAEIRARKTSFAEAQTIAPPWRLDQPGTEEGNGLVYSGLACSAGVAEGEVRILRSSDDFRKVRPGDILVARATPPAWTALFYHAGAVVTEAGSALCHGAVIAREVGIPAVMGLRGVMSAFQDGERVRVDGSEGRVFRLV